MTKQQLDARRQRNLDLGALDASNRCTACKRNLAEVPVRITSMTFPGVFCSYDCLESAKEREQC